MTEQLLPEFQQIFAAPGVPRSDLPDAIEQAYGAFGLAPGVVYGNFVASLDGIVAIPDVPRSSALISGGDPADRFVVALLRAAADAVVIGAGTFRAHEGPWTPDNAFPEAAQVLIELRKREDLDAKPTLVVVTASGDLGEPGAKLDDAIVMTTSEGAAKLGNNAPAAQVVEVGDTGSIDMRRVMSWLQEHGFARILTEGGPKLMGEALRTEVVDELFLTVSPRIVGGGERQPRPTLATGVELPPDSPLSAELRTVHRSGAYLFLRYSLREGRHVEATG